MVCVIKYLKQKVKENISNFSRHNGIEKCIQIKETPTEIVFFKKAKKLKIISLVKKLRFIFH